MPAVEKFDFCQTMRMAEKKFEMEKRKERELLQAEIIMLTKSETDREKNSNYKKRLRQSEKE